MKQSTCLVVAAALMTAAALAHAFEFEAAVPLTIGEMQTNSRPAQISVSLDGREIGISAKLSNDTNVSKRNGYYAYTPLFHRLGEGEEHYDKSFADFKVTVDGNPIVLAAERRAYFLGKDVTADVKAVGLDPLPSEANDAHTVARIRLPLGMRSSDGRDWEGFASYSWLVPVGPATSADMEIRYRALPQFSLENFDSLRLKRLVQQHCGDAERVTTKLRAMSDGADQLLVQRYNVPITFLDRSAVRVSIAQPDPDWMGARPLIALMCGLTQSEGASFPVAGVVDDSDTELSILVISSPVH